MGIQNVECTSISVMKSKKYCKFIKEFPSAPFFRANMVSSVIIRDIIAR